jgi:hypothetical protein
MDIKKYYDTEIMHFDIHKSVHLQYIRKMQPTRCYVSPFFYFIKFLYMFQAGHPPIIRSSVCTYSFWYCQNLLLPSAIMIGMELQFIEINKLRNVASCWLQFGNKLCPLMYLSIRRNKTLRVEILLLFCRDIARPSFIYGIVRQVAVMAVTTLARGPSFSRSLASIFADKSLPLGNGIPYSTQLCFKNYL